MVSGLFGVLLAELEDAGSPGSGSPTTSLEELSPCAMTVFSSSVVPVTFSEQEQAKNAMKHAGRYAGL